MFGLTSRKYQRTNHTAGFLIPEMVPLSDDNSHKASPVFVPPKRIDSRDMCISSSSQGSNPHCSGYSTAGECEYYFWKRYHYPIQIDGSSIYYESKKNDGYVGEGTSISGAAKAAITLGYIKGTPKYIAPARNNLMFALHEFGVLVGGCMITNEWNYVEKATGKLWVDKNAEKIGAHAILFCGYDLYGPFIQNSWTVDWGLYGFAQMSWQQFDTQFMYGMVIIPSEYIK